MFYLSAHFTPLPIFLNIFLPIYSYYRFYLSNCFTHLSFLPDNSFTPLLVYPFAFCQYTRITRFIHQTVLPIYRLYRTTCLLHYLFNPSNHFTYVTVLPVLLFYPSISFTCLSVLPVYLFYPTSFLPVHLFYLSACFICPLAYLSYLISPVCLFYLSTRFTGLPV